MPDGPPAPGSMPAPRKSGYYGENPLEMPLPGADGYRRDDRGFDRDRMPADRVQPERRDDRGTPERRSPSDTEKPRTNPPDREENRKPPSEARVPAPATIIVTLPTDAALT